MPDVTNREELERKLARALGGKFAKQRKELLRLLGNPPRPENVPVEFWENGGKDIQAAVMPIFREIYMQQAEEMLSQVTVGVDWALVNEHAIDWVSDYTFKLVNGITNTSRNGLQKAISAYYKEPMTIGELEQQIGRIRQFEDSINPMFGPVRSEMIAVTEVTRASVEGERAVVAEIEKDNDIVRMVPIWQTNNDDLVCAICGPRHDKEQGDGWEDPPPAHPRCRCWLNHEMRLKSEEGQREQAISETAIDRNYLPEITTYTSPGVRIPSEEQINIAKERIKHMPAGIRALEPIDKKYRMRKRLDGTWIEITDEMNFGVVVDPLATGQGSAFNKFKAMYLSEEFIGTPIQDHEYIHTLTYRNFLLEEALQKDYKPLSLFYHAKYAQNVNGEQFTMLMTCYDDDKEKWVANVQSVYKLGTEEDKLVASQAKDQIEEITRVLKGKGIWQ